MAKIFTASPLFATVPALTVLVSDNDAPGMAFDPPGGLRLSAATSTLRYTAALTAAPTGDVTVRLSSDDSALEYDADGQSFTVAFDVRVEFHWPRSGWRNVVPTLD